MTKDTQESLYTRLEGLQKRLKERKQELDLMQQANVKFQRQQGTKEDIYRLNREIAEVRNLLVS